MLKIKNLIISQIVITLFFSIEFVTGFLGRTINYFLPCIQNPKNSAFCFIKYDIYFLLTLITLFILNAILIIIILIINKNAKNRIG